MNDRKTYPVYFNKQYFEVPRNEDGLVSLTDIEKAWRKSGGKSKRLEDWKRKPYTRKMVEEGEYVITASHGRDGRTWGNHQAAYSYIMHCDIRSILDLVKVFTAISNGNKEEAESIVEAYR